MSAKEHSTIHHLLEKLNRGDEAAAEEIFRAYEPFLRMVVRRQLSAALRAKFDSADVVQSVWADLLKRFRNACYRFPDPEHLRAFLVQATRNRFLDHLRRRLGEIEHEQPLHDSTDEGMAVSCEPDPCEVLQADELWEQLQALCPPAHLPILELRRQQRPIAEIAERTGLHEGSVRRILFELSRRLASQQKRQ
jgi:RNA polymerase sigma-70 factor (ECF subfamily)